MTETESNEQPIQKSVEERLLGFASDYMEGYYAEVEKQAKAQVQKAVAEKLEEINTVLHKGFGLKENPIDVSTAGLISLGRKEALKTLDTGKRTPAPIQKGGSDGGKKPDEIEELFRKYAKGEV